REVAMSADMPRRHFLKTVPAAAFAMGATAGMTELFAAPPPTPAGGAIALETFDYQHVTLLPSRWKRQADEARAFYLGISNDDILHGFRKAAKLAAPGKPLGGWCGENSNTVFGQWLSGMARLSRATDDIALKNKAITLFTEWAKTVPASGDARMDHYAFDKLVCGLVDLAQYAGHKATLPVLARVTAHANTTFQRAQAPVADITDNKGYYGRPQEWYTLGENLLRAYQLTGNQAYRTFAEEWFYHGYWHKFVASASPDDAHGVHAYSHVNTFSSAAMAYEVSGSANFLKVITNAYDYLQKYQVYATGGYGPNERFMKTDGSLGRALDTRSDTCEAVCGSWGGFKLSRYLMRFTGDARYGDWIERLFYNGIGAALHVRNNEQAFYYADYRVGGGMKVYNWDTCTCCSGTYLQNMAEFHNLIYFKDADALYVNLFVPSTVQWNAVHVTQETRYPDADTTTLTVKTTTPSSFALRFRVPSWTKTLTATVNGAAVSLDADAKGWAGIRRTWKSGDVIAVKIPLAMRMEAVDTQHPDRVAVVRGPVVLVLEGAYHDPNFRLPMTDAELATWIVPETGSTLASGVWSTGLPPDHDPVTVFRVALPDKLPVRLRCRPFYEVGESYPYFMYFDRKSLPWKLW
ncbi:MAG: beta-L-arabinofuranosidase domain-containing protein, partial [Acidobacteriota bacterium]